MILPPIIILVLCPAVPQFSNETISKVRTHSERATILILTEVFNPFKSYLQYIHVCFLPIIAFRTPEEIIITTKSFDFDVKSCFEPI